MNKEVKKKWVAALKSGEYSQGRYNLKKNGNFCCLGVLCDIHSKENNNNWDKQVFGTEFYLGRESVPPIEVMNYSELLAEQLGQLVFMNDSSHSSFQEIADYIEENL